MVAYKEGSVRVGKECGKAHKETSLVLRIFDFMIWVVVALGCSLWVDIIDY